MPVFRLEFLYLFVIATSNMDLANRLVRLI